MTTVELPLATTSRRWLTWLNMLGTALALLLIFAYFSWQRPRSFPTAQNAETIARQTTIVAIAAMGMTLIIISGGIDLSVGSMVALTTVVIAQCLTAGFSPLASALAGIATGALCGLLNGVLITALRVVPFIVTLGTLGIYRGVAKGLAGEQKVDAPHTALSELLAALGPDQRWQLAPIGVWLMLAIVVATGILLNYTRFGRHVFAVGSNEQTARLCGVPVNRVKISVYALGGMLAGVAGLMQFSRLSVGDPTVSVGLELDVIAAVVIGGGSLAGGEGSPLGALVGAAIMMTIRAGGSHMDWPNWRQEIIAGGIIVAAVALDRLRQRRASGVD